VLQVVVGIAIAIIVAVAVAVGVYITFLRSSSLLLSHEKMLQATFAATEAQSKLSF